MNNARNQIGKIVIISGPSGVGKSTICKEIVKRLDNAYLNISATTRPPGQGEVNGREYWFISEKEFHQRLDKGLLLEHAEVFGHLYGTPKDKVEEALQAGKTVILEIDVQGGKQIKGIYPEAVMIFILPPEKKQLAERLNNRGRDDASTAAKRLRLAEEEIEQGRKFYEYKVVNDNLEDAINEVMKIIQKNTGVKRC